MAIFFGTSETFRFDQHFYQIKDDIQEKYPFPIQVDAKNYPPASSDRFTVRISDKSSFDTLKNQDDAQDEFFRTVELISNYTSTTNVSEPSDHVEIDSDTLRMFSLVYDAIVKMVKNVSDVPELVP